VLLNKDIILLTKMFLEQLLEENHVGTHRH